MKRNGLIFMVILAIAVMFAACKKDVSNTTGWSYNDPNFGGFQNHPGYEQETGPGLVFIEGGTFAMGRVEQDVMRDWNNIPRRVTVSSFYMDEVEVTNLDYCEYLHWLSHVYASDYRFLYTQALPDTAGWRSRMAYNEPFVELYLRHPAYEEYPVVNVSWTQASKYCEWRTDRVNELILLREGIIDKYLAPQDQAKHFNLDAYMFYADNLDLPVDETGKSGRDGKVENLYVDPSVLKAGRKGGSANTGDDRRWIGIQDGIFLPRYRLPTEAEWEFAALAIVGNQYKERIYERRLYPWNGHYIRNDSKGEERGRMMANSMRGRGDAMGVAGALNDKADITAIAQYKIILDQASRFKRFYFFYQVIIGKQNRRNYNAIVTLCDIIFCLQILFGTYIHLFAKVFFPFFAYSKNSYAEICNRTCQTQRLKPIVKTVVG